MSKRTLIAILVGCAIFFVGVIVTLFLCFSRAEENYNDGEDATLTVIFEETYEGEVANVAIDWLAGNLTVLRAQDGTVRIVEESADPEAETSFTVTQRDHCLDIRSKKSFFSFIHLGGQHRRYLTVYLPDKEYNSFSLDASSGRYLIEDLAAGRINMDYTSGSLEMNNVTGDKMTIEATSGSGKGQGLRVNNMAVDSTSGKVDLQGAFNEVGIESTSGSCNVATSTPLRALDIDITSGNASVTLPENQGFSLWLDKTSGRFKSDFVFESQGEKQIYKDGGPEYRIEMTSGNVTLRKGLAE